MTWMSERAYEVLGDRSAPMRGRKRQMADLLAQLGKPTPDHISVIGPKRIGKTMLLRHLAAHIRAEGKLYLTSVYWNLHDAPAPDGDFRAALAREVARALVPLRPDLADENPGYDWLTAVLGILEDEGLRILVILDEVDRLRAAPAIGRNLWDNLRFLAQKDSLWLVTGTRRRLREICLDEESLTSDFWEIFTDPMSLGPFAAADWEDVLQPIRAKRAIELPAEKEIINWTGGVPVLVAALASRLVSGQGPVTKAEVDVLAGRILDDGDVLDDLWDDCDAELRGDLADLARGPLPLAQVPPKRRSALIARGYAAESGGQVRAACRLMDRHALGKGAQVSDLRRLFAAPEDYARNARTLLELRLNQVQGASPHLRDAVEQAVRLVGERSPDAPLMWFRPITERAFDAIWRAEVPSGKIPASWAPVLPNGCAVGGPLPRSLGAQCQLLDRITATTEAARVARHVGRPTSILVETVKGAGDYANHRQGAGEVTLPMVVSFCLAAIELLDALARELPGGGAAR
jgi:hypothetical protein